MAQPSISITSATGEMVVDCVVNNHGTSDTGTFVQGAGQTLIGTHNVGAVQHSGAASDEAGAASVTMSWTGMAVGNKWAIIGVSLKEATGGGGGRTTKNTLAAPLGMEIGMNWRGDL